MHRSPSPGSLPGPGRPSPSLWLDQINEAPRERPRIADDLDVDVVIVGAGFTGLWTAYHLTELRAGLRIAVVEAVTVGFGASGRNGGWCIPELANDFDGSMHEPMLQTVRDIESTIERLGIDCDFHRGGELHLARNEAQRKRLAAAIGPGYRWLEADEARSMCGASQVLGGAFTPHTAVLQPAKLVHGLAMELERRGVVIYEHTRASIVEPRRVRTATGDIRADRVVLATEGYTSELQGRRRELVPLYSLMVATEPLPPDVLADVGLHDRPSFADARYRVIYGQRTADDRLAFGGRAAPYRFGSRIERATEQSAASHEQIRQTLIDLFPAIADVAITHRWGGVLGVPRNWKPFVTGRGDDVLRAGGYVGEGVAASHLAGQTLAELVLDHTTERTALPWVVASPPRRWPVEPFRWLGINAGAQVFEFADKSEQRTGRPSRMADLVWSALRR